MATKTITITEDAYERLRAMKREGESFTDVVLRITGGDTDLMQGFGAWGDSGLRESVDDVNDSLAEDFEDRQDALSGD